MRIQPTWEVSIFVPGPWYEQVTLRGAMAPNIFFRGTGFNHVDAVLAAGYHLSIIHTQCP
jgi:hypothetical protein